MKLLYWLLLVQMLTVLCYQDSHTQQFLQVEDDDDNMVVIISDPHSGITVVTDVDTTISNQGSNNDKALQPADAEEKTHLYIQQQYQPVYLSGWSAKRVLAIPKGKRPDPSEYLKEDYIRQHLRKFDRGASFIMNKERLDKTGKNPLGRENPSDPKHSGQFVMSATEMDDCIRKVGGSLSKLKDALGIDQKAWQGVVLIRVDIPQPFKLNVRIPSGNEPSANEFWIPGGLLPPPNQFSEAVVDMIPFGSYTTKVIDVK